MSFDKFCICVAFSFCELPQRVTLLYSSEKNNYDKFHIHRVFLYHELIKCESLIQ